MKQFTKSEVFKRHSLDELWLLINGLVYDVTKFHIEHPGGIEAHLSAAGSDATECFEAVGHSEEAKVLMKSLLIGEISDLSSEENTDNVRESTPQFRSSITKEVDEQPLKKSQERYTPIGIPIKLIAFVVPVIIYLLFWKNDVFV